MNQIERYRPLPIEEYRNAILDLEEVISKQPGAMQGDCFPLTHTFADGIYVRQIIMPAGAFLTSKIHKVSHPYFILKGKVSVYTEDGIQYIEAPYSGITKAGTKRVLHIHEETIWTTIHRTDKTNIDEIEDDIIAKDFNEIDKTFIRKIGNDTKIGGLL